MALQQPLRPVSGFSDFPRQENYCLGAGFMQRQAFILSIGSDMELLDLRSQLLRAEGYAVQQESDLGRTLISFRDGDFDLIVICHSVPEKDRLRIVANAKRIKPSTLVLLLTKDSYGQAARLGGRLGTLARRSGGAP